MQKLRFEAAELREHKERKGKKNLKIRNTNVNFIAKSSKFVRSYRYTFPHILEN